MSWGFVLLCDAAFHRTGIVLASDECPSIGALAERARNEDGWTSVLTSRGWRNYCAAHSQDRAGVDPTATVWEHGWSAVPSDRT